MKIKSVIIFAGSLLLTIQVIAQRPFVNSLSKYSAPAGEIITINGSNFIANSQVNFGPAKASFTFKSSTQLEVTVPANAVYAPVTVINLTNRLSGSTVRNFMLSFGGSTINASDFGTQSITSETGTQLVWDVALLDLDLDGDLDAVTTHRNSNNLNVIRNSSTITTDLYLSPSITPANPILAGDKTNFAISEDLNNDGKSDLIISGLSPASAFHILIYANQAPGDGSTINLGNSTAVSFRLPTINGGVTQRNANQIQASDIDGDGLKDLVIGSGVDATLLIYRNTSSGGTISFDTNNPTLISVVTTASILDVAELNGDDIPDILVGSDQDGKIAVLKNKSIPGTIMFNDLIEIGNASARTKIKIADFNNDGLGDIAQTNENGNVIILTNTTPNQSSEISFTQTKSINITQAYGIDAGDINGDGLVDLAVGTQFNNGIKILENISSGSTIDFASPISIEVERLPSNAQKAVRHLKVADMNADGKPDLIFAFNSQDGQPGAFSVITNRNCLSPAISPENISFCYDIPFSLSAPKALGVTYNWEATNAAGATFVKNNESVDVTIPTGNPNPVTIKLTMTSSDGNCTDVVTQNFSVQTGAESATPTITNSATGTICGGDNFTLSTSTTGAAYLWVLPDGSEVTDSQIVVTGSGESNAGTYSLRVQEAGKCYGDAGFITVDINIPPDLSIVNQDGNDNFCAVDDNVVLEVPSYPGFSLKWYKDGGDASNATSTLTATTSGIYTVDVISDATGCTTTSEGYEVFAIQKPTAMFNADAEICVDLPLDFEVTSTGETGFAMTHIWDFGDGNTASGLNVTNTFTSPNTYAVKLTSSYDDVDICEDIMTMNVVVSAIPTLDYTIPNGNTEKCPSDSILLELPQGYQSYNWSTGSQQYFTYAKTDAGQSTVDITAEVVTNIGCSVSIPVLTISNFANSGIEITSSDFTITNDTITLESGIKSVTLTAFTTGGSNYMWAANDLRILSTTTGETVEVFPKEAFTSITATATDINSCTESKIIVIEKPGLQPRKAFSPNGDFQNDCWEIINSEDQVDCTIYIFDERGSQVFQGKSPFVDNCVWNGKVNGNGGDAPAGIYFFVLKCNDKSSSQSGTILLAN